MKANFHQSSGSRSGVVGASAVPSAPVVPRQTVLLSGRTIDTAAFATGAPLSRRVTNTRVFCGLSFTLMPRFVTWTIDARVCDSSRPSCRAVAGRGLIEPLVLESHQRGHELRWREARYPLCDIAHVPRIERQRA